MMSDLLLASSDILPPLTAMPSNGNGSSMNVRLPSGNSISNGNIGIIPGVTRSATMNTMTGAMIGAPSLGSYPAGSPPLIRNVSTSRSTTQGGIGIFNTSDWRSSISVEERISLRKRLRDAYQKQCVDYQTLLDTVIAVDEELIFAAANNRLDYFKIAIDWDARIKLKRQQLSGSTTLSDSTTKKRSLDDTMSILPLVTGEASNSVSSASTGTSIPVPAPIMTPANSESLFPTLSTGNGSSNSTFSTSPASAFKSNINSNNSNPISPATKKESTDKEKETAEKEKEKEKEKNKEKEPVVVKPTAKKQRV